MTLLPLLLLLFPLLSISLSTNTLPPCTIIGGSGRIGSLLSSASPSNTYLISSRTPTPYADLPSGPIYIATRNDVLNTVIENTPPDRLCDLVFLQNGYVEDFLKYKLPGVEYSSITQALLFFAVTKLGAAPIDGVTSVSPEGLTSVTGKHADDLAARCKALGLKCTTIADEDEFRRRMFEKLMWIDTLQLVGDAMGESTVGEAQEKHRELIETVFDEMAAGLVTKGTVLSPNYKERLLAYTDVVSIFPPAVKEFEWRNKFFYDLGEDLMNTHNSLLRKVGAVPSKEELIKVTLPLPPCGIVFEEIEPGRRSGVVVTALTPGGAAEREGSIQAGDILKTTTAVKIPSGTSKAVLVEVDATSLDFDTVVSAISSHEARFRVDQVEMTFLRKK